MIESSPYSSGNRYAVSTGNKKNGNPAFRIELKLYTERDFKKFMLADPLPTPWRQPIHDPSYRFLALQVNDCHMSLILIIELVDRFLPTKQQLLRNPERNNTLVTIYFSQGIQRGRKKGTDLAG